MGAKAFTLIEYLIYVALLTILTLTVASLLAQFIALTKKTIALREIQDSARTALALMAQEVKQAKGIYTPTSVFGTSPGQLSLETKNDLPAQELSTYVDFYVDGQGIYQKHEGQNPTRLTSKNVQIKNLTFTLLNQASIPGVRIGLSLQSNDFPGSSFPFTLTVSLRPQS